MSRKKRKNNIIKYFEDNPNKLYLYGFVIVVAIVGIQLFLFYNEKLSQDEIIINSIQWSEYCDGRNYTFEEKKDFCTSCINGDDTCDWPLDINFSIFNVESYPESDAEIHCLIEVNGKSLLKEKGSYYGITENPVFTWELLDATKEQNINICCGIERQIYLTSILSLEKKWPQACKSQTVQPRCK